MGSPVSPTSDFRSRLERTYAAVRTALLAERHANGWWEGELSTSALATATAVMALEMVRRKIPATQATAKDLAALIERGVCWLAQHQNGDGGWGDTTLSKSNISTTMLCHAVFHATRNTARFLELVAAAKRYVDDAGGVRALRARYGKDKTFSIPILTHCALAGLVDWREVSQLPFELACVPANFYKWARLPVVSYALPALIAIGQVRHHFVTPKNLPGRAMHLVRRLAIRRSLRILEKIQPTSGGFLEATPLTSFVTMALAGMGKADHPVASRGVEFLIRSVRPDGSWPIDTNLATWVTTLSINALGPDLPAEGAAPLQDWLLGQQYREVHPYTNADPGGWAWTDLSGGVPDADDTPGAILALLNLARFNQSRNSPSHQSEPLPADTREALARAVGWLLDLQNSDGGWPTFCRGWGALPFDRSAPDLTAHAIRALQAWLRIACGFRTPYQPGVRLRLQNAPKNTLRADWAIGRGFEYLKRRQRPDGDWLPLWFGNQHAPDDENPVYGTARVLAAYRDCGLLESAEFVGGIRWLRKAQNADGGWGGGPEVGSSQEETALALEILASLETDRSEFSEPVAAGLAWLLDRIDKGKLMEPSPIGFYFAKLWYFEKLYPLVFTCAALRRTIAGSST